jgi:hypothetical protein
MKWLHHQVLMSWQPFPNSQIPFLLHYLFLLSWPNIISCFFLLVGPCNEKIKRRRKDWRCGPCGRVRPSLYACPHNGPLDRQYNLCALVGRCYKFLCLTPNSTKIRRLRFTQFLHTMIGDAVSSYFFFLSLKGITNIVWEQANAQSANSCHL